MPNEVKLLPCRACDANCRVERFSGSHIIGVMELYMCANGPKFGGDCPDPFAYLSAEAWNHRPTTVVAGELQSVGASANADQALVASDGAQLHGLHPAGFDPSRDSIWFGPVKDDEGEDIEDLLTGEVICGCGATLQTYAIKCHVPYRQPCAGFFCVEGARLHRRRRAAIAMEASQGGDGETRLHPKDDSAGPQDIAQ